MRQDKKKNYLLKGQLVSIILISIYLMSVSSQAKSSDFLLETTANKKYNDFSACLESTRNFFTLCIDELQQFIIAENKFIKATEADENKNRLRKVVNYIKIAPTFL